MEASHGTAVEHIIVSPWVYICGGLSGGFFFVISLLFLGDDWLDLQLGVSFLLFVACVALFRSFRRLRGQMLLHAMAQALGCCGNALLMKGTRYLEGVLGVI